MPDSVPNRRDVIAEAIIQAVERRLAFNVAAYGQAWTGETADAQFICSDAAADSLKALADAGLVVVPSDKIKQLRLALVRR